MPFTILIVDDEREMCASLSEIFASYGFASLFTTDPLAVPALLETERVDLIVMDIRMPQLRGIDLLKRLQGERPLHPGDHDHRLPLRRERRGVDALRGASTCT